MKEHLSLAAMLCAALVLGISGCATSPTGRKQLILMPDSQMNALGAQAFADLRRTSPTESVGRPSEIGAQVVPSSVERNTPPSAPPA